MLAKKILTHNISANYRFETAVSEERVLYKDDSPLDDPIDPVWFATDCYGKLLHKEKQSITVILGTDSGYILKEFSNNYKGKIILHEPDTDSLRIFLNMADISQEPENKNLIITNTYEDIEKAFKVLFFPDCPVNIVCSPYYLKNGKFSREFKAETENICELFRSNCTNLFMKNMRRTLSIFDNIPKIVVNPDLHDAENGFKNKPAVIISAGPSADKNIHELKPYRNKVVVFCVGTALKTAIKHGIIPDFVVVSELSPSTKTMLDIPEIANINVIIANATYGGVFELKAKRFFNYYGDTMPAANRLGKVLNAPTEKYREAGTVSLTAFYSAKISGCNKFIFIGQDLAYTDNKCYSRDSIYGDYKLNFFKKISVKNIKETAKNINVPEEIVDSHIKKLGEHLVKVKGQNGKYILTRPDFFQFIKYFETAAKESTPDIKLINSTEGGAFLKEFNHIPLKEALSKYAENTDINIEAVLKNCEPVPKKIRKRKAAVSEELNKIISNFDKVYEIIADSTEKNILPFFNSEVKELLNTENYSDYIRIYFKMLKNALTVSGEEKEFFRTTSGIFRNRQTAMKNNIAELYENSKDDFYKNFNAVKNDFIRINNIADSNPYIKNLFIKEFYTLSNKIKNSEEEEEKEKITDLSMRLNWFILSSSISWREYMKKIPEILKNLDEIN